MRKPTSHSDSAVSEQRRRFLELTAMGVAAGTLAATMPWAMPGAMASGLTATNLTLGYVTGEFDPFEHTVKEIGQYDALIRRLPEHLLKVLSVDDIHRVHDSGRVGIS